MDFTKVFVIPAQAGIQDPSAPALALDPRFPHGISPWAEGARGDSKLLKL